MENTRFTTIRPGVCRSDSLDQEGPAHPAAGPEQQDPAEFQLQVDFFRKLGYSQREVRTVLQKLGLNSDTNADEEPAEDGSLKPIVIDGSNVAMSHGNKEVFSCQGIQLAVNYFLDRGHSDITVFVPSWRKEQPRPDVPITDQHVLRELERKKIVVFTPSRRVGGKRVVCYDDRFIVKLANESGGIIVSNDTYRDLQSERPEWKRCVEEQLLMYSFVNDKFMPPDDPLGRHGPSLENFLRKKPLAPEHKRPPCPYGKKCTYGIKCKFYHQDRAHHSQRSLADELRANAKLATLKEDRRPSSSSPKKAGQGSPPWRRRPRPCPWSRRWSSGSVWSSAARRRAATSARTCFCTAPGRGPPRPEARPKRARPPITTPRPALTPPTSAAPPRSVPAALRPPRPRPGEAEWPPALQLLLSPGPAHLPAPLRSGPAPCQPWSPTATFGGPCTRPPSRTPYSLPASFPRVHRARKYWSDSYQPVPPSRSANSLPDHLRMPAPRARPHGSLWRRAAPLGPPPHDPFQAEREEVRKKLQAIFHPCQVDKVMGMFPHVLDPQALAAKILTLKSQGGAL
ncbi:hypothetical protein ANANG_G00025750 [Anguilla anguilla]|uniref:C3H1-type domain-containing protein n=1 Tax=Anguilla anguilla TaxID=7936 RepID=A0A9D3SCD7_ANGAN|nr:hypothetical protein ANANG_G00025750 [Anguilla anguilla]